MKRLAIFPTLCLAVSMFGFMPTAHAQSVGQTLGQVFNQFFNGNDEASERAIHSFSVFMDHNPDAARDLMRNPQLVNDRGFVDRHGDLREWLNAHPDAARAFHENPNAFMDRVRDFQRHSGDMYSGDQQRSETAHFAWFLDNHPEIRHDLRDRPWLANQDGYLDNHPELRGFFERHPMVRNEMRNDPRAFMDRVMRSEQNQGEYHGGYGYQR